MIKKSELGVQIQNKALIKGQFILRSGQETSYYFDKYRFESDPQLLEQIALHLRPFIPPETELLAGLELGGIPLASALSLLTGIPCVYIRKKAKEYGTCQIAEGARVENQKICIIEDIVTSGGAVCDAVEELKKCNGVLLGLICVINRNKERPERIKNLQLPLMSLFTSDDFNF